MYIFKPSELFPTDGKMPDTLHWFHGKKVGEVLGCEYFWWLCAQNTCRPNYAIDFVTAALYDKAKGYQRVAASLFGLFDFIEGQHLRAVNKWRRHELERR